MGLYLYALAQGLSDLTELTGVTGEPLALLDADGVMLVAGRLATAPGVDPATLAAQDRVVRALHARAAALLPARFGSLFASADAVRHAVTTRSDALRAALDLVRGREQMTLRVVASGSSAGHQPAVMPGPLSEAPHPDRAAGPGARYRAARTARARPPQLAPLLEAADTFQHGMRVEPGRAEGMIGTVYHLIARGADSPYRRAVAAAAATRPDLTVHVSGPSPCYAFGS